MNKTIGADKWIKNTPIFVNYNMNVEIVKTNYVEVGNAILIENKELDINHVMDKLLRGEMNADHDKV